MNNNQPEKIKVICPEDCGNAPRKLILKEISIAFAQRDVSPCINLMTDHIVWDIIGRKQVLGKEKVELALKEQDHPEVIVLQIDNIITHGSTASVNGNLIVKDNRSIAFCDVYNFASAGKHSKIKKITSFVIQTI